ncbi:hypothetical protein CGK03_20010 [Vibrio parahaemolyticus]|nr:hypothetical protein CGK03_20010 [Vibrio parahaemolyticus]
MLPVGSVYVSVDKVQCQSYIETIIVMDEIRGSPPGIYDMIQQTKRIRLSEQQRYEAITRSMSGVIVSVHTACNIKKARRNIIQQMRVAVNKAVLAE